MKLILLLAAVLAVSLAQTRGRSSISGTRSSVRPKRDWSGEDFRPWMMYWGNQGGNYGGRDGFRSNYNNMGGYGGGNTGGYGGGNMGNNMGGYSGGNMGNNMGGYSGGNMGNNMGGYSGGQGGNSGGRSRPYSGNSDSPSWNNYGWGVGWRGNYPWYGGWWGDNNFSGEMFSDRLGVAAPTSSGKMLASAPRSVRPLIPSGRAISIHPKSLK